jgi:hypothetical protein
MKMPAEAWKPVVFEDGDVRSTEETRSAARLGDVLAQFPLVPPHKRYAPTKETTYCNIYALDVAAAMGVPVPEKHGGAYMSTNVLAVWLRDVGSRGGGWMAVPLAGARTAAAKGMLVLAVWSNPGGGHGHVAVGAPGVDGDLRLNQAGRVCRIGCTVREAFGDKQPTFWVHQ